MDFMNYKISIIIPVFNVENYIREALESIVKQTIGLENLEVIMVNDCSTDKSGAIINEYASRYDNFKALHLPENSGAAGKPRNIGLKKATANYLMFLDPDDYYTDDACEVLYNKIIAEDADIVFSRYLYIHNNKRNKIGKSFNPFENEGEIKLKSSDDDLRIFTIAPSLWTKIIKKNLIIDNNITFPEGIPGQDLVFVLNVFLEAKDIIYLSNYFSCNYRIRNSNEDRSISRDKKKEILYGLIEAYQEVFNILTAKGKEEYFPPIFNVHLQFWAEGFIICDAKPSEKMELLEKVGFLFEELIKYGINPNKKYLTPLFNDIGNKRYDEAILLAEILSDFIKKQNQLKEKVNARQKQVKELQTTLGWLKYKTKNISHRFKRKMSKYFKRGTITTEK